MPTSIAPAPQAAPTIDPSEAAIMTARELESIERANIQRALAVCGGKISGPDGAAYRLGLPPSTLSSRIKALGIQRPA
jgi:transcriptional regulator with GAF, ATPase, and Fis domain